MNGGMALVCSECGQRVEGEALYTYCQTCTAPYDVRYNLEEVGRRLSREEIGGRQDGLWRWAELLPLRDIRWRVTLGEGATPLLSLPRLGERYGLRSLYLKDESKNPTASFKARGIAVALSRLLELGARHFVLATAGNAGGALAVYAARANRLLRPMGQSCSAHIFMPASAPLVNRIEVQTAGADLHLVEGTIYDAGQAAQRAREGQEAGESWFDLSTFKEPYRVEGKKTLGFELAEQFQWQLPDVIIYPTGGGTGLVGMWKAFDELEQLGWIGAKRPRMISVQAEGCAPLVRAFEQDKARVQLWENPHTIASGLCVPKPFADRMLLRILRASQGEAVAVSDEEIGVAQAELADFEGVFSAPEGAATVAALKRCVEKKWIEPKDIVVLFNTASGLKYLSSG
jgi:threonine synthase